MLFDDTVYKCSLHSITSDIRVMNDRSKRENIAGANTEIVGEIMVQPTINPNMYREIVTGMLIPAYRRTVKVGLFHDLHGDGYYRVPKKPVFIKINDQYLFGDYTSSLKVAQLEEIKEYIEKFSSDIDSYRYYLNSLFEKAEACYDRASLKGEISEKTKIKMLVKSIGKK